MEAKSKKHGLICWRKLMNYWTGDDKVVGFFQTKTGEYFSNTFHPIRRHKNRICRKCILRNNVSNLYFLVKVVFFYISIKLRLQLLYITDWKEFPMMWHSYATDCTQKMKMANSYISSCNYLASISRLLEPQQLFELNYLFIYFLSLFHAL